MTELRWDGKYRDGKRVAPVRIALPFQTVETVNESMRDRARTLDLFATGRPTEWRNRLIWGDKKYVLPSLLPEFAGRINLVYIDPPFDTGADFSFTTKIPGTNEALMKRPSMIEQKAYRDTWGRGLDSYLQWFYETVALLRELMAETATAYVHLDDHVSHYAKAVCDEVLGSEAFQCELIWKRTNARSTTGTWPRLHDVLLVYARVAASGDGGRPFFEAQKAKGESQKLPHTLITWRDGKKYQTFELTAPGVTKEGESGRSWRGFDPRQWGRHWANKHSVMNEWDAKALIHWPSDGGFPRRRAEEPFDPDAREVVVGDVWTDIDRINQAAGERVGYATQKPEALLERIIKASSRPDDLVLDCFCGSGTTVAVAEKLGRRWIACDLGRFSIHTTRKRLLNIAGIKPFVVQNLGKYERKAWMDAEFDTPEDRAATEAAYRQFILDLFDAEAISGHAWLHGIKSGRFVHVGAVDSPVTLDDVKAIARDALRATGKGKNRGTAPIAFVDVLGWEFAFELNETGKQIAADARVDVRFRGIPRDVLDKRAIEQGDIQAKDFFELRVLSTKASVKKRVATLELVDFMMPAEDLPQDVRRAVKSWSQWIDYWAIDWDFKGDTFHNEWQSYRTRDEATLELAAQHEYTAPGKYSVVVKVIDLLGCDTTKIIPIEVR